MIAKAALGGRERIRPAEVVGPKGKDVFELVDLNTRKTFSSHRSLITKSPLEYGLASPGCGVTCVGRCEDGTCASLKMETLASGDVSFDCVVTGKHAYVCESADQTCECDASTCFCYPFFDRTLERNLFVQMANVAAKCGCEWSAAGSNDISGGQNKRPRRGCCDEPAHPRGRVSVQFDMDLQSPQSVSFMNLQFDLGRQLPFSVRVNVSYTTADNETRLIFWRRARSCER